MFEWLSVNYPTVLISLLIAVPLGFALRSVIRNLKQGNCAGGCAGCSMAGSCQKIKSSGRELYDDFLQFSPDQTSDPS